MVEKPLPDELRDLIERVARHNHGLGFLHQAYLESVAVTLRVHPFVIDAARAYLATAEGRQVMIEEVRRVHQRSQSGATPSPPAEGGAHSELCKEAENLIRKAQEHPHGVRILAECSPEELAATFGVHPFIVFRARGALERQGIIPGPGD